MATDRSSEKSKMFMRMNAAQKEREWMLKGTVMQGIHAYIVKLAKKILGRHPTLEMDDVVSAGFEGALRAWDNFNPRRDNCFLTYAHWWILKYLVAEAAATAFPISLTNQKYIELVKYKGSKHGADGEPLLDELVMVRANIDTEHRLESVKNIEKLIDGFISINDRDETEREFEVPNIDPRIEGATAIGALDQVADIINDALDNAKEFYVVVKRIGVGCDRLSLEETGLKVGCCKERVRQIQKSAQRKIQEILTSDHALTEQESSVLEALAGLMSSAES